MPPDESAMEGRVRRLDEPVVDLSPFALPSTFWSPEYLERSAWFEHLPFAFWLVEAARPRVLVELGTHNGTSYFGFCQAVAKLGLDTACFAIDTWKGDEHAGFYGSDVYKKVRIHHDRLYSGFSRLIRSTFEDALPHFQDSSVDVLHIDGLHTYEAVKNDFESWRRKLSPRAVVVFHDINVRERGFGVFRLYAELCEHYPHFDFLHGNGLGVLGVGGELPVLLRHLCDCSADRSHTNAIRSMFARLGLGCFDSYRLGEARQEAETRRHEASKLKKQVEAGEKAREEIAADRSELEEKLAKQDERVLRLSGDLEALKVARTESGRRIEELKTKASALREARLRREERIAVLVERSEKASARIAQLKAERTSMREAGEELSSELLASRRALQTSQDELRATGMEISRLRDENDALIEALQRERRAHGETLEELQLILASRFWRVTAPFRGLARRWQSHSQG